LHHDNAQFHTSFFTRELLTKTNMAVVPYSSYFVLIPRLKIKLKGRHFDTTEVIEAESQAVLNTPTKHTTSRVHLKMAEALGTVHRCGRGSSSRVMVASRPKVRF
jgi:hypothetical protein